jgi:Halocarboxylic acid dehydrogenase DehI
MTLTAEEKIDDPRLEINDDIKATLRVSVVPMPFRLWSKNPQLLELLWSRLKPNLETRYIEYAADRIRKQAVRMVSMHRVAYGIHADDISLFTIQKSRLVINVHHYINPKISIVVSALVEALQSHAFQPVKDPRLGACIPRGVPPEMAVIPLLEEPSLGHNKRILLKEIQRTLTLPDISTEYLGLAHCDGYLEKAWSELQPFTQTSTYWTFSESLQLLTRTLVHGLPLPLDLRWGDFGRIGIAGLEILNEIIPFQDALPRLILNMAALKVGLDGVDKASQSPYPIEDSN